MPSSDNTARKILSSLQTLTGVQSLRARNKLRGIDSSAIRASNPHRNRRFWQICLGLAALLLIGLAVSSLGALSATAHYRAGVQALKNGKLDKAVSELTASMPGSPSLSPYYYRALAYAESGNLQGALQDYDYLVSRQPGDVKPWLGRACLYLKMRRYEDAIDDCSWAINAQSQEPEPYRVRASVEMAAGKYADCVRDCKDFLEKTKSADNFDQRVQVLKMEAISYSRVKDYDKAIDCYNQATVLQPFNEELYEAKAELLQRKGSLADAIADCSDAIKIKPSAELLVLRASLYNANKQLIEAIGDLNAAIKLEPKDIDLRRRRGALERALGQMQQAYADYKFVMESCPGSQKAQAEFEEVRTFTPVAMRRD